MPATDGAGQRDRDAVALRPPSPACTAARGRRSATPSSRPTHRDRSPASRLQQVRPTDRAGRWRRSSSHLHGQRLWRWRRLWRLLSLRRARLAGMMIRLANLLGPPWTRPLMTAVGSCGGWCKQPSPVELRAQLEQLLGQHAILTVRLTRARLRGDEDLAQTADEALSKNAADLAAPIGAVYGVEAAETFEQAWFNHVTYVFNYARGVADNDAAVKAEARSQLDGYTTDLSEFWPRPPIRRCRLKWWPTNCTCMWTSYWSRWRRMPRRTTSALSPLERECYAHMFPLGKALAAGIVTGEGTELPAEFDSPAAELQSQLGMTLGEHAELAGDAMRSGVSGLPDFPAAAGALDQNTTELTGMIEVCSGGRVPGRSRSCGATILMPLSHIRRHWPARMKCTAGRRGPAHRVQLRLRAVPFHGNPGAAGNGRVGGRVRHARTDADAANHLVRRCGLHHGAPGVL